MSTPGKAAYEKHYEGAIKSGIVFPWESNNQEYRDRWEATAQAAIDANYALWGPDKCRNCH